MKRHTFPLELLHEVWSRNRFTREILFDYSEDH